MTALQAWQNSVLADVCADFQEVIAKDLQASTKRVNLVSKYVSNYL